MLQSTELNVLDFVVKKGIAKGWRVVYEKQNLEYHKKAYRGRRVELYDPKFLKEIRKAVEDPLCVYPGTELNEKTQRVILKYSITVFYRVYSNYLLNGKEKTNYTKVVARKNKKKKLKLFF